MSTGFLLCTTNDSEPSGVVTFTTSSLQSGPCSSASTMVLKSSTLFQSELCSSCMDPTD